MTLRRLLRVACSAVVSRGHGRSPLALRAAWAYLRGMSTLPPPRFAITEAEIDVFERWFGDLFDELLGPHS